MTESVHSEKILDELQYNLFGFFFVLILKEY